MKRILMISFEFPPQVGGIATYVDALSEGLKEQVIVLVPPMKEAALFDQTRPFRIIRQPFLFPRGIWPRWLRLFWHTWQIIRKEKIDIIYLHHVLPVGTVAWMLKKITGVPYIIFSHGTDVVASASTAWKRWLVSRIGKHAAQIIVNSDSLKDRLVERFPDLLEDVSVLYPWPDTLFLEPADQEKVLALKKSLALEGVHVLLSIGRLADGKGFPHLLRLMPEILKSAPNTVLVLIGDGPKRDVLLSLVEKYQLQNVVRILGEVPHGELRAYYALADAFILLTHPDHGFEEGLGLVYLEAAAAGVPVIAGRSGGVEEAVLHNETGFVVDTYQEKTVLAAVQTLFTDIPKGVALGLAAKERVKREFSLETQIERLTPWR